MNLHRLLFSLDLKANPAKDLSFIGRLSASKVMNNGENNTVQNTFSDGRGNTGDLVYLERAFINYVMFQNLTLSIGRLPTTDGPPTEIYDNLPRQGSYPIIVYSAIVDGYALTYNLALSGSQNLSFRVVHTPFTSKKVDYTAFGDNIFSQSESTNTPVGGTPQTAKSVDFEINSFMVDYNSSSLGFTRDFIAIYQYLGFKSAPVSPGFSFGFRHHDVCTSAHQI